MTESSRSSAITFTVWLQYICRKTTFFCKCLDSAREGLPIGLDGVNLDLSGGSGDLSTASHFTVGGTDIAHQSTRRPPFQRLYSIMA